MASPSFTTAKPSLSLARFAPTGSDRSAMVRLRTPGFPGNGWKIDVRCQVLSCQRGDRQRHVYVDVMSSLEIDLNSVPVPTAAGQARMRMYAGLCKRQLLASFCTSKFFEAMSGACHWLTRIRPSRCQAAGVYMCTVRRTSDLACHQCPILINNEPFIVRREVARLMCSPI
jgi:hypothetical protein